MTRSIGAWPGTVSAVPGIDLESQSVAVGDGPTDTLNAHHIPNGAVSPYFQGFVGAMGLEIGMWDGNGVGTDDRDGDRYGHWDGTESVDISVIL